MTTGFYSNPESMLRVKANVFLAFMPVLGLFRNSRRFFGLLMVKAMADELLFNEKQNEVVFIKYLDPDGSRGGVVGLTSLRFSRTQGRETIKTCAATS